MFKVSWAGVAKNAIKHSLPSNHCLFASLFDYALDVVEKFFVLLTVFDDVFSKFKATNTLVCDSRILKHAVQNMICGPSMSCQQFNSEKQNSKSQGLISISTLLSFIRS